MTVVLESSPPITRASAVQMIRSAVVRRDDKFLYMNECAASWITAIVRGRGERSAEAVLADIATVCEALAEVDLAFFTCEGTG